MSTCFRDLWIWRKRLLVRLLFVISVFLISLATLYVYHVTTYGYIDKQRIVYSIKRTLRHLSGGKVKKEFHFTHFRNICVDSSLRMRSGLHPFQARLTAYDNTKPNKTYKLPINFNRLEDDNYWQVDVNTSGLLPRDVVVQNSVVYFASFWRDSAHIFLLFHYSLPYINEQIEWSKNIRVLRNETAENTVLVTPKLIDMPQSHRDTLAAIGINKMYHFPDLLEEGRTCFANAIFGNIHLNHAHLIKVRKRLVATTFSNAAPCSQYYVTFIQRKNTRNLLDIEKLVELATNMGYENVRIVYFEGTTLVEQFEIIHCTSVLIGVQGAALTWYGYLPKNAAILEIIYQGWPMSFQRKVLPERPDVTAKVLLCDRVTSDGVYAKYAKVWFNYTGAIDSEMKTKLERRSDDEYPVKNSVYKDSDCRCAHNVFVNALQRLH